MSDFFASWWWVAADFLFYFLFYAWGRYNGVKAGIRQAALAYNAFQHSLDRLNQAMKDDVEDEDE